MDHRHYVTIHGKCSALEDLQHGAHPSLSTQTIVDRLRRYVPLDEAKATPGPMRAVSSLHRAHALSCLPHPCQCVQPGTPECRPRTARPERALLLWPGASDYGPALYGTLLWPCAG